MRWVVSILGMFALAVGVALAMKFGGGYVLLVLPSYRLELSFTLLLLVLLAGFIIGYMLLRFVFGAIELPARVREYRRQRARDRAHDQLMDALQAFLEGRHGRAEKSAAAALDSGVSPGVSAVLAARAAHARRRFEQRDAYLARARKLAPADNTLRAIAAAEMLLDQHREREALDALASIGARHAAALRLELKALQQARDWNQVLPLIDEMERRGIFDADQAGEHRRYAHSAILEAITDDVIELDAHWRAMPQRLRLESGIAALAARQFLQHGDSARAGQIVEDALDAQWDSELVGLYGECEGANPLPRIERAEKWLSTHAGDAALLRILGALCARLELWGKSQSYLEASIAVLPSYQAHLELARLFERIGNSDASATQYRKSLDLAVSQLSDIQVRRFK